MTDILRCPACGITGLTALGWERHHEWCIGPRLPQKPPPRPKRCRLCGAPTPMKKPATPKSRTTQYRDFCCDKHAKIYADDKSAGRTEPRCECLHSAMCHAKGACAVKGCNCIGFAEMERHAA